MKLRPPHIKKAFLDQLESIVGAAGYSTKSVDRLSYARDSNFKAAIQHLYGKVEFPPDAIAWPENVEQVQKLVKACIKHKVPVVPFGAGSGVCGGVLAVEGGLVIDMKKMYRLLHLDTKKLTVTVEAGIMGMHLENQLQRKGYTLGHFPSSIICASMGGYLAARSAGQNSSRYGKIEDMVQSVEVVTGTGDLVQTKLVNNSPGIDLNQIFVGSEGTLCIFTKACLRVYPLPEKQIFQGYRFANMTTAMEAIRRMMQTGLKPSVVRLYDEFDTLLFLSHGEKSKKEPGFIKQFLEPVTDMAHSAAIRSILRWPKFLSVANDMIPSGCLLILIHEGQPLLVKEEHRIFKQIAIDLGAEDLAEAPARRWLKHRYSVSYKASPLFSQGAFTDTIEVATTWDRLEKLYNTMRKAMAKKALVMAHISHSYTEGASIYFTFVAPLKGLKQSEKLYDTIWDKAMEACLKVGGIISHHHGIGRLKAKYMLEEWGEGAQLFRHLKKIYDPHGMMNPGKLLLSEK